MAKKIKLSDDSGSNYYELPGAEGGFTATADEIDDTILGQNYQSNEVGLIEWRVTSDGIFKGFAGYLAKLLKSGSATTMTGEACANESGLIYAISDSDKEIWDRATGITVKDDGSAVAASNIEWIDYLFGRVKFITGYSVSGAITVDGKYFPTAAIGAGNGYELTMSAEAVDISDFPTCQGNGGYKVSDASGLKTVALDVTGIFSASEAAAADLAARSELIVEIDPAGDGSSIARGFFKIVNAGQDGKVGASENESIKFSLTVPEDSTILSVFSWRHTSTTLAQAIQIAIDAWLTEDATTLVQYLPSGATGASPTDGKQGAVVFTNISLSGGLSNMNVFKMEMMGTGAVTTV